MALLTSEVASADRVAFGLVQVTVKVRVRPPTLLEKAESTVPLASASSPSVIDPSRLFGLAVHFDATVPVTVTVPLTAWAWAGVAARAAVAPSAAIRIFFMTNSFSDPRLSNRTIRPRRKGPPPPPREVISGAAWGGPH